MYRQPIHGNEKVLQSHFFLHRGRLEEAVKCFNKALPLARDEAELSHIYSLRDAAIAQMKVCERYNIKVPNL